MTNSNSFKTATIRFFAGVNAGYQGENVAIKDRDEALKIGTKAITSAVNGDVQVLPAVVVYHTGWGCPIGGEVGVCVSDYSGSLLGKPTEWGAPTINGEADAVRKVLNQTTVTVGYYGDKVPVGARGTVAAIANVQGVGLNELAAFWQEEAFKHFEATGTYPSLFMCEEEDGSINICGDANSDFVKPLAWMEAIKTVGAAVAERAEVSIDFDIFDSAMVYLKKEEA